jgi:hypothetical protein
MASLLRVRHSRRQNRAPQMWARPKAERFHLAIETEDQNTTGVCIYTRRNYVHQLREGIADHSARDA